jgi:hypothetical protein
MAKGKRKTPKTKRKISMRPGKRWSQHVTETSDA